MDIKSRTIQLIDSLKAVCGNAGLGNDGNEYKIITEIFLYKFLNDKFAHEAKQNRAYGKRLSAAEKWDAEYDKFTDDEVEDLWSYMSHNIPRLKPEHTLGHLYNSSKQSGFGDILDGTLLDIANANAEIFSMASVGDTKITIFDRITTLIQEVEQRDNFACALVSKLADFNFEDVFDEKYDFFSDIFEYLIKDYNTAGGGKYAEYFTPKAIATIIARLLVGDNAQLTSKTCYDPTAGSGTLLMALAHQIGTDRCTIYSQDISQKSSQMLRLNLILNDLVDSIQNIVKGNTLTNPAHKNTDGSLRKFDFVVSNPPFKLDFSDYRETIATDKFRFWAGVPTVPAKKKESMAIYTCFIQHVVNSIAASGKGAIVIPTGFITAKSGIENKILHRLIDDHIVSGVVSMPSNVFANTGTNVSVLFFDKSDDKNDDDTVILIDASKLGEEYKDANGLKKVRLNPQEIEKIVATFRNKEAVDDFSVCISYNDLKAKGYSLSAGQYFDIRIEYVDISEDEFNAQMKADTEEIAAMFEDSRKLEKDIMQQLAGLKFAK
ncbi:MAG: SAM-dependent DNA methyltransferase [Bacteroidales bacterium]|nr:SAM-dependent DNA methyltransferase [Bacteroidales bacterium]